MNLLIISYMVLGEDTLNLLEVPVWDARNILYLIRWSTYMSIEAVGTVDAEAEAEVVALPVHQSGADVLLIIIQWVLATTILRLIIVTNNCVVPFLLTFEKLGLLLLLAGFCRRFLTWWLLLFVLLTCRLLIEKVAVLLLIGGMIGVKLLLWIKGNIMMLEVTGIKLVVAVRRGG